MVFTLYVVTTFNQNISCLSFNISCYLWCLVFGYQYPNVLQEWCCVISSRLLGNKNLNFQLTAHILNGIFLRRFRLKTLEEGWYCLQARIPGCLRSIPSFFSSLELRCARLRKSNTLHSTLQYISWSVEHNSCRKMCCE